MQEVLVYVFLATSVFLVFIIFLQVKRRRALERELSLIKENNELDKIEAYWEEALKEIENEKIKSLEELRQKRLENDEEIAKRQAYIDTISEDYKKLKFEVIEKEVENKLLEVNAIIQEANRRKEEELNNMNITLLNEQAKIEELRRNQQSVTEAIMRNALEKEEYCLTIDSVSLLEIKELQSIAYKYSRIRPIILKAIYDIYYAPEVKKLVSRIIGPNKITGIYKITSKLDGRVYVGKSVDISERWITHFKRAAGVETETTNLLYPAMRSAGLENFTFEVLEKVEDASILGQREKYWQEFYDAKTHGLSVR